MSTGSNLDVKLQEILAQKKKSRGFFRRFFDRMNRQRIVVKMLFLVVITTWLTIVLISSYFFFVVRPTQINSKLLDIEGDLEFLGDSFEQEINLSRQNVLLFSESSFLKQLIAMGHDSETYSSVLNLTRQQYLDLAKNFDRLLKVAFVNASLNELVDIERNLQNGEIISHADEGEAPPLFQPIFNRVKELPKGTIYTSNIQLDRESLTYPVIVFATPIYNQSNRFVGVVALTFYLQPIFDQIASRVKSMLAPNVELAMIDSFGVYLFNTVEPRWTASENGGDGTNLFISNEDVPREFLSSEKAYILIGNELFMNGEYLIQSRLDIEFTHEFFQVHFVLTVPVAVLTSSINQQVLTTILFVLIAGVIGAVVTIVVATYGLINPLKSLTRITTQLAGGDLGVAVEPTVRDDELGRLQNQFYLMVETLRKLVGTIVESNDLVTSISENVSAQAEEVTAAAEEVAASVQNVTRGASSQAEKISMVTEQLSELEEQVDRVVKEIQANARQINEIAQLTRILSLNATIEASRAGKDASGFMVIAENVQNLAQEARRAARAINDVVKDISENVSTTLEMVTQNMEEVASVSEETAALAEEVSASVSEVIGAMEEMTALSQSLSDQAAKAAEVVSKFRVHDSSPM